MSNGRLYLLPAWLSEDTPPEHVVPALVLERIRALDAFVVENAKSARRFIASCGHPRPLREIAMAELNEHTAPADVPALLGVALSGRDLEVMLGAVGAALPAGTGAAGIDYSPGELVLKGLALGPAQVAAVNSKLAAQSYATRLDGERLVVRAGAAP